MPRPSDYDAKKICIADPLQKFCNVEPTPFVPIEYSICPVDLAVQWGISITRSHPGQARCRSCFERTSSSFIGPDCIDVIQPDALSPELGRKRSVRY